MLTGLKLRGAAVAGALTILLSTGFAAMPTAPAQAGWRGQGYGGYGYGGYGGFRGYGGWRPAPYYGYGGYYGYRPYYNNGAAVAAGIAGLAAGAIIGGALAQPRYYAYPSAGYVPPPATTYDPSVAVSSGGYYAGGYATGSSGWYSYCASKYRSFDPRSGTYLGYDGRRHPCR